MTASLVNEIGRNVQAFLSSRESGKPALAATIQKLSAALDDDERATFMSAASQQLAQFTRQVAIQCLPQWALFVVVFILVVVLGVVGILWWAFLPPIAAMVLVFTEYRRRRRYLRDIVLLHRMFNAGHEHGQRLSQLQDPAMGAIRTGLVYTLPLLLATTGVALLVAGGYHALATTATPNVAPVMAWAGFWLILVSTIAARQGGERRGA